MEANQREAGGRDAAGREHRGATHHRRVDRDERSPRQRVRQPVTPCELAVEIARKAIVGDEDVGLAAQAPAQRGMLPGAAASQ